MDNTKRDPKWLEVRAHLISQKTVLQTCNKIALLLPAIEAREMYYSIRAEEGCKSRKNIFLGNPSEPLLSMKLDLRFQHWSSPLILQRVRGLKQSGIVEWFEDFVIKFMTNVRTPRSIFRDEDERKTFRPSNTNGNIVVVFVPFGIGVVVSMITFAAMDFNWKVLCMKLRIIALRLDKWFRAHKLRKVG